MNEEPAARYSVRELSGLVKTNRAKNGLSSHYASLFDFPASPIDPPHREADECENASIVYAQSVLFWQEDAVKSMDA
jgi:hypothetical protein